MANYDLDTQTVRDNILTSDLSLLAQERDLEPAG